MSASGRLQPFGVESKDLNGSSLPEAVCSASGLVHRPEAAVRRRRYKARIFIIRELIFWFRPTPNHVFSFVARPPLIRQQRKPLSHFRIPVCYARPP